MNQESIQSQAEIERLRQQLLETEQAYHLAQEMSKFKAGFLARIAHEIRSPLARVMNLNQAILTNLCLNPQEEKDFLRRGQQALDELHHVLDEIIAISNTANCTCQLKIQKCDLKEILAEVYCQINLQALSSGLKFKTIIPSTPLYVYADYHRLLHALTLLIDVVISFQQNHQLILEVMVNYEQLLVSISLDFCGTIELLSEPTNLINNLHQDFLNNYHNLPVEIDISPGSKFHLIADLLESMGGKLTIIENQSQRTMVSLQCLLPLAEII